MNEQFTNTKGELNYSLHILLRALKASSAYMFLIVGISKNSKDWNKMINFLTCHLNTHVDKW